MLGRNNSVLISLRKLGPTVIGFLITTAIPIFAQDVTEAKPAFDVASIKPSVPGTREGLAIQPGGRLILNGFPLKVLIGFAYHIPPFQMSGGDGWMTNDRWSIEAKADNVSQIPAWAPPQIPEVMAVRLRALLEGRFSLKVHREVRELKTYALTMGKSDSKLIAVDPPPQSAPGQQNVASTPPRAPAPGGLPGEPNPRPGSMMAGPGVIIASAVTITQMVTYLNKIMDLPVIDKTGLTGHYDIRLRFAPESTRPLSTPAPADGSISAPEASGDPSIFAAIVEQLGLNLRLAKEPFEVLVIDSARRPSEN